MLDALECIARGPELQVAAILNDDAGIGGSQPEIGELAGKAEVRPAKVGSVPADRDVGAEFTVQVIEVRVAEWQRDLLPGNIPQLGRGDPSGGDPHGESRFIIGLSDQRDARHEEQRGDGTAAPARGRKMLDHEALVRPARISQPRCSRPRAWRPRPPALAPARHRKGDVGRSAASTTPPPPRTKAAVRPTRTRGWLR